MIHETREVKIQGKRTELNLLFIEDKDRARLKAIYKYWLILDKALKLFNSRGIPIPEGLSENAFCLIFNKNCARALSGGSFDVFDIKSNKRIQIKAGSIDEDLTSFGPKSVWDDLYFLDFYRKGKFDGSFDVYKIPNKLIYRHKMNMRQTFVEQQKQGRRPRFSIKKDIIYKNYIKPLKTCKL